MNLTDVSAKINQLFGYTPSQSELLSRPDLLELGLLAIAANVNDLNTVKLALNSTIGSNLIGDELLQRPDLLRMGLLLIQSNLLPLISLADLEQITIVFNAFMQVGYTATELSADPILLRTALQVFQNTNIPLSTTHVYASGYWVGSLAYIFAARQPSGIPSELMTSAPNGRPNNTLIEGDKWRDTAGGDEYIFDGFGWGNTSISLSLINAYIRNNPYK